VVESVYNAVQIDSLYIADYFSFLKVNVEKWAFLWFGLCNYITMYGAKTKKNFKRGTA